MSHRPKTKQGKARHKPTNEGIDAKLESAGAGAAFSRERSAKPRRKRPAGSA